MLVFELLLTIFEANFIFRGSWGSIENWLKPKTIRKFNQVKLVQINVTHCKTIFGQVTKKTNIQKKLCYDKMQKCEEKQKKVC
jgi:hypothetical protein